MVWKHKTNSKYAGDLINNQHGTNHIPEKHDQGTQNDYHGRIWDFKNDNSNIFSTNYLTDKR